MAKTKSFGELVEHHVKGDKKFAEALLREGIDAMLDAYRPAARRRVASPRPARRREGCATAIMKAPI
jgi:hypothetical protein